MLPTPVFWPREFHGLYSPWGHKELDMTELTFTFKSSWTVSQVLSQGTHFVHDPHKVITNSVSVQFSLSVTSDSLQPHELQQARLPCSSPSPGACSNSCPLNW